MSIDKWTTASSTNNTFGNTLANGVYNDGNDLTCVNTLNGQESYSGSQTTIYGINNEIAGTSNNSTVCYPYVSLFGSRVQSGNVSANDQPYSQTVAPKNVTVKLTLVAGSATK